MHDCPDCSCQDRALTAEEVDAWRADPVYGPLWDMLTRPILHYTEFAPKDPE